MRSLRPDESSIVVDSFPHQLVFSALTYIGDSHKIQNRTYIIKDVEYKNNAESKK